MLPLEEIQRAMGTRRRSRDGCLFTSFMDVYCGTEAVITSIIQNGETNPFAYRYILKINGEVIDRWCFTTDMLEPVTDPGEGLSIGFSFDDLLR